MPARGEPVKMKLKLNKKALCCGFEFKANDIVYVFKYPSKRRIDVGVPYQGTYSIHRIRGGPGCLEESQ